MRSVNVLVLTATLVGLCSCAAGLTGSLKDSAGHIVSAPDARVNVTSLSTSNGGDAEAVICEVDAQGHFAVSQSLKDGSYLVEALVPGYALASQTVTIGKDSKPLQLVLRPLEQVKANAIGVRKKSTTGDDVSRGAGDATLAPPQW